jgi:16S rRNA (cytidine1402-2'-O)-methyltransferase
MSKLYLVPTPIGNLQDITLRALDILKAVDYILSEDTRKAGLLLKHFQINNKLRSFHKFNEHKVLGGIINDLKSGHSVALISDAGTPGISDPGFLIVRQCINEDIAVETLPGATAFVPALVNSGIPCERFVFEGFLPQKKGRKSKLESLKDESRTMVFYESPYRIIKTLEQFRQTFGPEREISISRELSKMYEETIRGNIANVLASLQDRTLKGEFVIVVEGKK